MNENDSSPPPLVWSEDYSVGHPGMDAQHRKLLALCVEAERCADYDDPRGHEVFHLVLNDLFRYADSHFAAEERLLAATGFPELQAHKDEHEMWLEHLADLLVTSLDTPPDIPRLRRFLRSWWRQHILGTDMQYRDHLLGAA